MIPLWIWLYFALVAGLYALIATLRYRAWRREAARLARYTVLPNVRPLVLPPLPYYARPDDVEELWD